MTSLTSLLQIYASNKQEQAVYCPNCKLKWRQGKLLVRCSPPVKHSYLPSLENKPWLIDCLKHSYVQLISIDPLLGHSSLNFWADACKKANKPVFLRLPFINQLPKKQSPIIWWFKRLLDWVIAALLLLVLSPILLGLAVLIRFDSPGPIFCRQWRVGERGKLFEIFKFRTMVMDAEKLHYQVMTTHNGLHQRQDHPRITRLGRWMRQYSLDELPQLFNVLSGEMSLVGPCPWALHDAVRISPEGKQRLNALPGITGAWQVEKKSTLNDLDAVNNVDLKYLRTWSLTRDLKLLLLTIPKVLLGYGA
jgi:lipopolysaccharide/colanic/teichoic acid biosynthesis glycosyltransferase